MSNKNVYILGTGFSAPVGIPSIAKFYDTIKQIHLDRNAELGPYLKECFKEVIDYRNGLRRISDSTAINLDNIETLFSYLDMDCECGGGVTKEIRRKLIYAIINTLELSTTFGKVDDRNSDDMKRIDAYLNKENLKIDEEKKKFGLVNVYEFFISIIAGVIGTRNYPYNGEDVIITFNYDIILDRIFSKMGIKVAYCYDDKSKEGIKYLKLHGSANWLLCKKCSCITNYEDYPKELIEECPKCGNKGDVLEPLIVPPTWNKSEYRTEINKIWNVAVTELEFARRIFIIGYSAPSTDMYFEYLISLGLKDNNIVDKIFVVDRDEHEIEMIKNLAEKETAKEYLRDLNKRYQELFSRNFIRNKRYDFKPTGVLNFINSEFSSIIGAREN